MINTCYALCLITLYIISLFLFQMGKKRDLEDLLVIEKLKQTPCKSYVMRVKRTDIIGSAILTMFSFTTATFPILIEVYDAIVLFIFFLMIGWASVVQFFVTLYKANWKVIVEGDKFRIIGFLKKDQEYTFNDIYYIRETTRIVNTNVTKFYKISVYEIIVGSSPPLRNVAFSVSDIIIGSNIFINRVKNEGKVIKDSTALG